MKILVIIAILTMVFLGIYYKFNQTEKGKKITYILGGIFVFSWCLIPFDDSSIIVITAFFGPFVISIFLGIKSLLHGTPKPPIILKNTEDSFIFSTNKNTIDIANPFRGILVIGGAGSGKSKTFIYPFIKQGAEKGFTGVIYDFKSPELIKLAYSNYIKTDIKPQILDFKNIENSSRCNPLEYIESSIHATNYTQAFIYNLMPEYIGKQDFWSRSILSLFSGCMWYFKKNNPKLATLPHIFAFIFSASAEELTFILSQDREVKGNISALIEAIEQGAEKQVAGILGTLKTAIGIYNNPNVFWLLSSNEINLNVNDPKNKNILLLGNDSTLSDTYAPLCSLIITICSKLMNEPNKAKSMLLIDETPTLYLPKFEQIPATGRSNKLAVIIGAQDISQLEDTYTKIKAEVLVSNLGTQFYGRTTNQATAERVVKMFGQREDIQTLKGTSKKGLINMAPGRSENQSIQKRDRVKIQEMTTLEQGQFVGMIAEGNIKEFKGQINLQNTSIDLVELPINDAYSLAEANKNFEDIYTKIEDFIKNQTTEEPIKKEELSNLWR